jgi:thiosulfate/3-mercaptopyruvate sulfurtransferase
VHAYIACTQCHGGSNTGDFARAHEGLIADPSEAPRRACGDCHVDTQAAHDGSLHVTLAGYDTALHARSVPENHPALDEMQSYHCESCHASCGQCHISQPTSVGGGLLEGHAVVTTPPMSRTCIGCHGSRVGFEYTGRNEGYPADVHLSSGRMTCADCHSGDEMHGVGVEGAHRYEGVRLPTCESCHAEALATADIEQHTIHGQDVACEVCHSVAYKNCSGCHVERTEDDTPFFRTEASWMDFRIGLNPTRTPERPWQYVLVRHVPISPTSFDFYGLGLLPNFDLRPTWLYTTPHNIQRNTPQTETCASCHGNPDIFLTSRDVLPEELEANAAIVIDIPPSLDLLNR